LTVENGGPAEGLAKLDYTSPNGDWRIAARDEGYKAQPEEEIVLRIRADKADTVVTFYGGESEGNDAITFRIQAPPAWRQIHIPLKSLKNPVALKNVGLRNDSGGRATVYVAYMYLKVKA